MALYRNISVNFWTDPKVVDDFSPEDKYIFMYLLTNPNTNIIGCYELSMKKASDDTGYTRDALQKVIDRLANQHNVIRYDAETKTVLIAKWHKYNWTKSEKMDKPIQEAINAIKCERYREYVQGIFDRRMEESGREAPKVAKPKEEKSKETRKAYGEYGWVKLTEKEYERLLADLGPQELELCITTVDEKAQSTGNKNKWKDWNLVVRRCHRDGWGCRRSQYTGASSRGGSTLQQLDELGQMLEEAGM